MPITIDEITKNHAFEHYARVQVHVDMADFLPKSLWVERENYSFEIDIEYEKPPYYCFNCNSIGHSPDHIKKNLVNKAALEKVVSKSDPVKEFKQDFVPERNVGQVQGGKNL